MAAQHENHFFPFGSPSRKETFISHTYFPTFLFSAAASSRGEKEKLFHCFKAWNSNPSFSCFPSCFFFSCILFFPESLFWLLHHATGWVVPWYRRSKWLYSETRGGKNGERQNWVGQTPISFFRLFFILVINISLSINFRWNSKRWLIHFSLISTFDCELRGHERDKSERGWVVEGVVGVRRAQKLAYS